MEGTTTTGSARQTRKTVIVLPALLLIGFFTTVTDANAQGFLRQKSSDLPKVNFYMARQQWQIVDDVPLVNDQRTMPGQPGAQQQMQQQQQRAMPLPRAGFQQYSPMGSPSFSSGLPRVENGVPQAPPPDQAMPAGRKAKTGKLKYGKKSATANKPATQAPSQSYSPKTYSPYKGYDPGTVSAGAGGSAAASQMSKTNVRGSVLHWARGRRGQ